MSAALDRATALHDYAAETAGCTRCPLAETRAHVVFGGGNPDAEVMLVGEAPGFHEDQSGAPFVGQAGLLLESLLVGIGLERSDVYLTNVLKCRPPQNRDPLTEEIDSCEPHLFRELELVQPKLIATLGNFATKLLSRQSHGITRVHGQPQDVSIGGSRFILYPLFHPAAALYTPAMLRMLEEDFARIPALLGHSVAARATPPELSESDPEPEPEMQPKERVGTGRADESRTVPAPETVQLGLF